MVNEDIKVGNTVKVKVLGYLLRGIVENITDDLCKVVVPTYYGTSKKNITVFENINNLVLVNEEVEI